MKSSFHLYLIVREEFFSGYILIEFRESIDKLLPRKPEAIRIYIMEASGRSSSSVTGQSVHRFSLFARSLTGARVCLSRSNLELPRVATTIFVIFIDSRSPHSWKLVDTFLFLGTEITGQDRETDDVHTYHILTDFLNLLYQSPSKRRFTAPAPLSIKLVSIFVRQILNSKMVFVPVYLTS